MSGLNSLSDRWLEQAQEFGTRHHRSIVAVAVTLLGGFGITAFGIAPMAPDAALMPQRVISESVTPDDLQAQSAALAEHSLTLLRNEITRGTDTPESLLARLGVNDSSAVAHLRSDATARRLLAGRGGKMVQAQAADSGALIELVARYPAERAELVKTHFTRMTIARTDGRWLTRLETVPLASQVRLGSGTIHSTLFAATDEAMLPDAVAAQLAEIFSADIDFHRELRKDDSFSVVYEALTADGEVIPWNDGAGRVLAAEFVNKGRAYHALWFSGADGKGAYFGLDGRSNRRSFLASPMEFSRVTSGFAMRLHPLLNTWRRHLGVDYGAPIGTPVRTVGEGTVDFAGWQNGYGNVVQIQHGGERSTLYAHLSRIDVKKGQQVEQGQRVGAVGMTGWSTGPHLHFEFRIRGEHQDPIQVAKASEPVMLDPGARERFAAAAKALQAKLDIAETLVSSNSRAE
jgi:murein DD-endopeptidase MepM/ murein hydrolase activator NlpD